MLLVGSGPSWLQLRPPAFDIRGDSKPSRALPGGKGELAMTDLDVQRQSSDPAVIRFWQRIPVVIQAMVLGLFVFTIGTYAWLVVLVLIPSPWPIVVMSGVLLLYWKYFSGSWWPKATADARRNSFRVVKLSVGV